ncbi:MAG: hypothetical protein J6Y38_00990, partial [Bacteroidaceae bacterium]|nr:hypothetical protein [Bacteroidaceae bacterium]
MNKNLSHTRVSSPFTKRSNTHSDNKLQVLWFTLTLLMLNLLAQPVWAASDNDETIIIDGKSYHVLRNNDDWVRFRSLVEEAEGLKELNAIMADDFTVTSCIGMDAWHFKGTFDGNGHTLNVDIQWGTDLYAAPFPSVENVTIKNLHVTGTVNGGIHSSGLVGHCFGQENHFDNCRVSATVNCTGDHVGGFIGHGHKTSNIINNCLFDGQLTCSKGGSYGGAFIGWEDGNTSNKLTNCLENGTYSGISHAGFCYRNGGNAYGNVGSNKNNWSYHSQNWGEMNGNMVGSKSASEMVTTLGSKNWQVVNGKVLPILNTYHEDYTFETYDIVPATDEGEEGLLRIPFSCDKPVKWLEVSYTDSDGNVKNLGRTNLPKDSYGGFITIPSTEPHKNLTITAQLSLERTTVPYDAKNDAVLHNPRMLKATVDSVGAVNLQWKIADVGYKDALDGDIFLIERSLTGKIEDFTMLEANIPFDGSKEEFSFRDSLLVSKLTPEQIDKALGIPLVRYRVSRASTQQMWGMDKNPTVVYVQPQFATLALLTPKNAKAEWSDRNEYKAKVTWDWVPNDKSHNYVWDDRAVMKVEVQMFNQAGARVDSVVTELSDEQITQREVEVRLNRSCVNYQVRLMVDGSKSPIGQGTGDIFVTLSSVDDIDAFIKRVNDGENNLNAVMTADIVMKTWDFSFDSKTDRSPSMIGYHDDKPYTGNFNGNGHTLTMNFINYVTSYAYINGIAPFRHAANGAVIANLTTAGSVHSGWKFLGGIVGYIQQGPVFIENCRSSMSIENFTYYQDGTSAGLVGLIDTSDQPFSKSLRISNSLFDGKFDADKAGGMSGLVGFRRETAFTMLSNCYFNPSLQPDPYNYPPCATFMRNGNNDVFYGLLQDCTYKTTYGEAQGKQSNTAPDNWCWKDGVPAVEQKEFSTPVSGSVTNVAVPSDKFYYESTGYLIANSLKAQPLQSSVVLTWNINEGGVVDYCVVMRRKADETNWTPISPQLSEMEWEDKTCSPVYDYFYKIVSHTDCEGLH